MKKLVLTVAAAAAVGAATLGLAAPAAAAPVGTDYDKIIKSLRQQGHSVILNKLSNAPLSESEIVSVNEGPNFTRNKIVSDKGGYIGRDWKSRAVQTRTFYVNVR